MKIFPFVALLCCSSITAFSQKTLTEPINSGEILQEAYQARVDQNFEKSLELVSQVHPGDTNYVEALIALTNTYFGLNENEKALQVCNEGLNQKNKTEEHVFLINKGYAYSLLENYSEAIKIYEGILVEYPYFKDAYNNLASAYLSIKDYNKSYAMYQKFARLFPFDSRAHFNLGVFAFNEGHLTEAFLALNLSILLEPNSERAFKTLSFLNELSNNTKLEMTPKGGGFKLESTEFDEIDLLIENYIALGKKYPVKTQSSLYAAKQNHLVFNQIIQLTPTNYFFYEYYVPFYKKLLEEGKFETMQLYELIASRNDSHKALVKKKDKELVDFQSWFRKTWFDLKKNQPINYLDLNGNYNFWYYNNGNIEAIGNLNNNGQQNDKWLFFDQSGRVSAMGNYTNGKKSGNWTYFKLGKKTENITYSNGLVQDTAFTYYANGNINKTILFNNDLRNGYYQENYMNNQPYIIGNYKDGYYHGNFTYYFNDGTPEYLVKYNMGKIVDTLTEFYFDNVVYRTEIYNDGKSNGTYNLFWPNNNLKVEANKVNGLYNGNYKAYFFDGTLEEEGEWLEGNRINTWKTYYPNGKLKSESVYDEKGKLTGVYKEFNYDGVLFLENNFKNGDVTDYKYLKPNGEIISQSSRKESNFFIENYAHDLTLDSKGAYLYKTGKEGKWLEYDTYGVLNYEFNYKNGLLEGESIAYYPWGKLKSKSNYTNDKANGLYQEFAENEQLIEQGYYENGKLTGLWITYFIDGKTKSEGYYVDGKLNGPRTFYAVNGKIFYKEYYDFGVEYKTEYFDSTGKILQTIHIPDGTGKYVRQFNNSKPNFIGNYNLGEAHGLFQWYYHSGNTMLKGFYKHGKKVNLWQRYYESGKIKEEENFLYGKLQGKNITYHENGQISDEREFTYGQQHGKNKQFFESGKIDREIDYAFGKYHGKFTFYDEASGKTQLTRFYNRGKFVAYCFSNPLGQIDTINVTNGTAQVKAVYDNGKPSRHYNIKNGIFYGNYEVYNYQGKLIEWQIYEYDQRHGIYKYFYANGNPKIDTNYNYGQKNGLETEYYENGKVKRTTTFINDEKHGTETWYDETGKPSKTKFFYNGYEF